MRILKFILLLALFLPLISVAQSDFDIVIDNTKTTDVVLAGAAYQDVVLSAWNPSGLANLVSWGKSYAGVSATGGEISSVADQSGSGNHVTQTTGAEKPDLVADAINSLPAINFDGNDVLEYTGTGLDIAKSVAGFTVSMLVKIDDQGAGVIKAAYIMSTGLDPAASRFLVSEQFVAGQVQVAGRRLDADGFQAPSGGTIRDGIWTVRTAIIDYANSNALYYTNGVLQATTAAFQTAGNTENTTSLFGGIGAASFGGITGQVVEWVAYDTAQDSTNRLLIEEYLNDVGGL